MNKKLPTVSSILRRGLLLSMSAAFLITTAATVFVLYLSAVKDTKHLLEITLRDVCRDIQESSDDDLLRLTRSIASAYEHGEFISLDQLPGLYNVSEVNVVDDRGVIVQTTEPRFLHYDMHSGKQSAEFLPLLVDREEWVQSLQPVSCDNATLRKYAGIKLKNGGFIQVGYSAEQYQSALADVIRDITANRHVQESGLVFIVDENRNLVSLRSDLPGTLIKELFSEDGALGKPAALRLSAWGEPRYYWMYVTLYGYTVVAAVPQSEALAPIRASIASTVLTGAVLFIMLFLSVAHLVRRTVVRQVDEVAESLSAIAGGDLNRQLDVRSTQEFAVISDGVNATVDALKGHIAREAARIDEELAYARRIQASAMPALTRLYTANPAFRLYADMATAREVGGDFYDFYLLDDHTLIFLIADVSGKGIPAAMFMMTGKTTLRDCAEVCADIGEEMAVANDRLCQNNDAGMFITAWMGSLDLETGAVRFANAGHNPPVLIRDGKAALLDMEADLILGIMDDGEYQTQALALQPGDLLLLYTDGVTEAANAAPELYGEARLLETLTGVRPEGDDICQAVCQKVKASVDAFADGAPQSDDITMLCLCYRGPAHS